LRPQLDSGWRVLSTKKFFLYVHQEPVPFISG